jgi:hypothetical protein
MSATEGGCDLAKGWVPPRGKPDQEVGDAAGRDAFGGHTELASKDIGHVAHPQEVAGSEEALAGGPRLNQGEAVEATKVANIDDFEADPWQPAHLALQHPADYPD